MLPSETRVIPWYSLYWARVCPHGWGLMVPLAAGFAIGMPASLTSAHPRRKRGCHPAPTTGARLSRAPSITTWGYANAEPIRGRRRGLRQMWPVAPTMPAQSQGHPAYELRLGMVWYFRPDDCGNDGRHTGYLSLADKNRAEYRACDPALWDELHRLVCVERRRCVHCVQNSSIFPGGTLFLRRPAPFPTIPAEADPGACQGILAGGGAPSDDRSRCRVLRPG